MVEETEYDEGVECHHSYEKRCHTTYTTDYDPQQVGDLYHMSCTYQAMVW